MPTRLHLKIDSAAGFYEAGAPYNRKNPWPISMWNVREWALVLEDTGSFTGSVDLDYKLSPNDGATSYKDNIVAGTRYTHIETDAKFFDQTTSQFLPTDQLLIHNDAYTSGSGDVYVILWHSD